MEALEGAKSYLQTANADGKSLHDHLADLLLVLLQEKPADPVAALERLSLQIKEHGVKYQPAKELPAAPLTVEPEKERVLAALDRVAALCKRPKPTEEDEKEETVAMQDILSDLHLFSLAGVGFAPHESAALTLAVHRLAGKHNLTEVRFFGKVLGTKADYWIVEAKEEEPPEAPEDVEMDAPGEGVNAKVYYATTVLGGVWTRLPDVTPQQIVTARSVRRFFTGDLTAPVLGFPRFPWPEAAFLRAQVARIAHSCEVCPKGVWALNEEDEETVEKDEEAEPFTAHLTALESWVHRAEFLRSTGRLVAEAEEKEDEEEGEEEEDGERIERLRPLNLDAGTCWSVRVAPHPFDAADESSFPHAVVACRSHVWPGALAVAKLESLQYSTLYVGFGLRALERPYTVPPPPVVQTEYVHKVKVEDEEEEEEEEKEVELKEQTDPKPPPPKPKEEEEEEEEEEEDEEDE